jgi:hypothetical protein
MPRALLALHVRDDDTLTQPTTLLNRLDVMPLGMLSSWVAFVRDGHAIAVGNLVVGLPPVWMVFDTVFLQCAVPVQNACELKPFTAAETQHIRLEFSRALNLEAV